VRLGYALDADRASRSIISFRGFDAGRQERRLSPNQACTVKLVAKATIKTIPEDPPAARVRRENIRRDRAERRVRLISAIARGGRWLHEIITGSITDATLGKDV